MKNIIFEYVDEIDSTNDELKRRISDGVAGEFSVLSAGMQTGGRGRSGHAWTSPKGSSVSTSMVVIPEGVHKEHIPRLTPLAAVAVGEAIEELYDLRVQIKWPNDILLRGHKVCGILTELILREGVPYVVIGIGVNVHVRDFPPEISGIATSIDLVLENDNRSVTTHCEDITRSIWEHFVAHYSDFLLTEDLSSVLDYYNERLVNKGSRIKVLSPIEPFSGEALGIDETGALHVMTEEGERLVDSGEVSVRGFYGYV